MVEHAKRETTGRSLVAYLLKGEAMTATGVGSMPGADFAESVRIVAGETPELLALPELPARGHEAGMIGRGLALLSGLGADVGPAGWRLTDRPGIDQRRARSLLAHDLDVFEEYAHGLDTAVKIQIPGPWTLAGSVELPRGERVLADHGARRDLAASLTEGLREHIADVRRRLGRAALMVQVDEPLLPTVLAGGVRTASGLHRYGSIDEPEADAALRALVDVIVEAGARPIAHSCAPDLPVALLVGSGVEAISFDLTVTRPDDMWAEAFESGVDLWPGIVPSFEVEGAEPERLAERVRDFFERFGFGESVRSGRVVITPTCGLAEASPGWPVRALTLARRVGAAL